MKETNKPNKLTKHRKAGILFWDACPTLRILAFHKHPHSKHQSKLDDDPTGLDHGLLGKVKLLVR